MVKLDRLQLRVMKVLWKQQEASVSEIREILKPYRHLAITTIGTVLTRLKQKSAVDYRKRGREYIYFPLISEKEVRSTIVSSVVDQFFQGDSIQLANYLLKEEEFTPEEIEKLRKLIDNYEHGQ